MSRDEEIKGLLEKVSANLWDYSSPNVTVKKELLSSDRKDINQALTLLKEKSPNEQIKEDTVANLLCYILDHHEAEPLYEEQLQKIGVAFLKSKHNQAVALLKDPPCSRCGGSGQVDDYKAGNSHMLTLMECPKCHPEKK